MKRKEYITPYCLNQVSLWGLTALAKLGFHCRNQRESYLDRDFISLPNFLFFSVTKHMDLRKQ